MQGIFSNEDCFALAAIHVASIGSWQLHCTRGYITPEYFKFPGFLSPSLGLKFADVPNGLAALSKSGS